MSKNILLSKTFWGAVLTLLLLMFPHVFTALGLTGDTGVYADKLAGGATTLFTIWARLQAGGVHLLKP